MICDSCADTACPIRGKYKNMSQCLQYKPCPFRKVLEVAAKPWLKHLLDEQPLEKGMPVPTEDQEQIWLFRWADNMLTTYPDLIWMYHNANGGKRTKAEAGIFRAMGVKPGVPDICLPFPIGKLHGLYVELKRLKDSKTTDAQLQWQIALEARGYRSVIRKGWRAAANAIILYLNGALEADESCTNQQ